MNRVATRISGEARFETSVAAAQASFATGADTVVLARHDIAADSVSAAPLAKVLKAPVLLTPAQELHPATAKEITRLKAKKVVLMGGHVALSPQVEAEVAKLGVTVERVAGQNRAATAVATATKLKEAKALTQIVVADGTDWQASLIAAPAAAAATGATLLTNGKVIAPETKAFIQANTAVQVTAVGDVAINALPDAPKKVAGTDATALSVAVAKAYFPNPKAVGVATTADFADALTGGVHVAQVGGPLVVLPAKTPTAVTDWLKGQSGLTQIYVYGGPTRITDEQLAGLVK